MPRWSVWVTSALLIASITACSPDSSFSPPAETAAVRSEEARLAPLIERYESRSFSGLAGVCQVRLLGTKGNTSFAWANCAFPNESGVPTGAISAPVRVDGRDVRMPRDGDLFAQDVRHLFPTAMARIIVSDPDRLRPRS